MPNQDGNGPRDMGQGNAQGAGTGFFSRMANRCRQGLRRTRGMGQGRGQRGGGQGRGMGQGRGQGQGRGRR